MTIPERLACVETEIRSLKKIQWALLIVVLGIKGVEVLI